MAPLQCALRPMGTNSRMTTSYHTVRCFQAINVALAIIRLAGVGRVGLIIGLADGSIAMCSVADGDSPTIIALAGSARPFLGVQ